MANEEMITSLPTVSAATMSDIIYAVQGYTSPSNLGLSVQESLQQVYNLFQSNVILSNAGNPNGLVAGTTYQLCWDTTDKILWVCTISGSASTAVWTPCIPSATDVFVSVTGIAQQMAVDVTYQANNAGLVTLTLPATAIVGQSIRVTGFGAGGWLIAQNSGQQIIFGHTSSTVGIGGSIASTNRYDGIELVCVVANTTWQNVVAPQGIITVV